MIGFGLTLSIAVIVKCNYELMYFYELIKTFLKLKSANASEPSNEGEIQPEHSTDKMKRMNISFTEDLHQNQQRPLQMNESSNIPIEPSVNPKLKIVINFIFLLFKAFLAILLGKKLQLMLSLSGSIVGYLEIIVFPSWLVIKINQKHPFLPQWQINLILFVGFTVGIGCLASIGYNLIHP